MFTYRGQERHIKDEGACSQKAKEIKTLLPNGRVPVVLILGCSDVQRAEDRAFQTMGGDLGLNVQVEWHSLDGMRWQSVVPRFIVWLRGRSPPDVLVVHCGGNDLGRLTSLELILEMKGDLPFLQKCCPQMKIVLSGIINRRNWGVARPRRLDHARRAVNSTMARVILGQGGAFINHYNIRYQKPELFFVDEVHLSPVGYDLVLRNFIACLRTVLLDLATSPDCFN